MYEYIIIQRVSCYVYKKALHNRVSVVTYIRKRYKPVFQFLHTKKKHY